MGTNSFSSSTSFSVGEGGTGGGGGVGNAGGGGPTSFSASNHRGAAGASNSVPPQLMVKTMKTGMINPNQVRSHRLSYNGAISNKRGSVSFNPSLDVIPSDDNGDIRNEPPDLRDPAMLHLLLETATLDGTGDDKKGYTLLTLNDVDEAKKELLDATRRITPLRKKLAMGLKVQEAASNLCRLNGTGGRSPAGTPLAGPRSHGRNQSGHMMSTLSSPSSMSSLSTIHGRNVSDASSLISPRTAAPTPGPGDDQLATSSERCEQLALELYRQEILESDLRRRLLEHTVEVLKAAVKASTEDDRDGDLNGYARNHKTSIDHQQSLSGRRKRAIIRRSIMKNHVSELGDDNTAPSRDQNHSLTLAQLCEPGENGNNTHHDDRSNALITEVEKRLHSLNQRVHAVSAEHSFPAESTGVHDELAHLEQGLDALVQQKHGGIAVPDATSSLDQSEDHLHAINDRLSGFLESLNIPPPVGRPATSRTVSSTVKSAHLALDALEKHFTDILSYQSLLMEQLTSAHVEMKLLREGQDHAKEELSLQEAKIEKNSMALSKRDEGSEQALSNLRSGYENKIKMLEEELEEVSEGKEHATEELEKQQKEISHVEHEMARLQTELTISKAELDTYIGRKGEAEKEREIADLRAQIDGANEGTMHLMDRLDLIKTELRGVVGDYSTVLRDCVESEREKVTLERQLDDINDKCEALKIQLSDERLKTTLVQSEATNDGNNQYPNPSSAAAVLRDEFKKIIRSTREENKDIVKAEQEERRKLQGMIHSIRKGNGGGGIGGRREVES